MVTSLSLQLLSKNPNEMIYEEEHIIKILHYQLNPVIHLKIFYNLHMSTPKFLGQFLKSIKNDATESIKYQLNYTA